MQKGQKSLYNITKYLNSLEKSAVSGLVWAFSKSNFLFSLGMLVRGSFKDISGYVLDFVIIIFMLTYIRTATTYAQKKLRS